MTNAQFFTQLTACSLISALALFGLFQIPQIAPYQLLGWISLGGFVLLSILMFFATRSAAHSENKNDFTSAILGFMMGKMFMAIMVLYAYMKLVEPADKFFIAPFFTVYFIFTAFEAYFTMRVGRTGV